jgi:hypothetical protein
MRLDVDRPSTNLARLLFQMDGYRSVDSFSSRLLAPFIMTPYGTPSFWCLIVTSVRFALCDLPLSSAPMFLLSNARFNRLSVARHTFFTLTAQPIRAPFIDIEVRNFF